MKKTVDKKIKIKHNENNNFSKGGNQIKIKNNSHLNLPDKNTVTINQSFYETKKKKILSLLLSILGAILFVVLLYMKFKNPFNSNLEFLSGLAFSFLVAFLPVLI